MTTSKGLRSNISWKIFKIPFPYLLYKYIKLWANTFSKNAFNSFIVLEFDVVLGSWFVSESESAAYTEFLVDELKFAPSPKLLIDMLMLFISSSLRFWWHSNSEFVCSEFVSASFVFSFLVSSLLDLISKSEMQGD